MEWTYVFQYDTVEHCVQISKQILAVYEQSF